MAESSSPMNQSGYASSNGEQQPAQGIAGIGLLMQQDGGPNTKVFIKSVVPGGACQRDGTVSVGDYVVGVNGVSVQGFPVSEIRERIVGPIGSTIKVLFEKPDGQTFERTFTRMNAQASADGDYTDQMMKRANGASMDTSTVGHRGLSVSASAVNMGVEPELVRLRGRVHELESELTICKDELSRARSLIEQDKDSSTRYVKELDIVHRKNQESNAELRAMLNQSEQARRELEIQIQSLTAREELIHEQFQRAKDKTEAREQYFADLKRKFEDIQKNFEKELVKERDAKAEVKRDLEVSEASLAKFKKEFDNVKDSERQRREKEEGVRKLLHEAESKLLLAREMEDKVSATAKSLHLVFGQWQKDFFVNKSKEEAELEQYFLA